MVILTPTERGSFAFDARWTSRSEHLQVHTGDTKPMEVSLVDIGWLRPHEEVRQGRVEELCHLMEDAGRMTEPILVDRASGTILDGHHRYTASLRLGLVRVPAIQFAYLEDEAITVDVWPDAGIDSVTKRQVVDMALRGERFAPKTTRHTLPSDLPEIAIPLDDLR